MLKKRIIPIQLLMKGRLVKTVQFGAFRDVGNPVSSSRVYSDQDADELIFLNIERDSRSIAPLLQVIAQVSEVCFMPLGVGGGIRSSADAEILIRSGADKVVLNSIVYEERTILSRIAKKYGNQAVVLSIDVRRDPDTGVPELYSDCGRKKESVTLADHIGESIRCGAGEIFINSIDRDGMMQGYDLPLIQEVAAMASVPVIACGGAGNFEHMKSAFIEGKISALGCGSLFSFGDNNPIRAKAFLSNHGLPFKVKGI